MSLRSGTQAPAHVRSTGSLPPWSHAGHHRPLLAVLLTWCSLFSAPTENPTFPQQGVPTRTGLLSDVESGNHSKRGVPCCGVWMPHCRAESHRVKESTEMMVTDAGVLPSVSPPSGTNPLPQPQGLKHSCLLPSPAYTSGAGQRARALPCQRLTQTAFNFQVPCHRFATPQAMPMLWM